MDTSTIAAIVIGVSVLGYHIYVGYLCERANLSRGSHVVAVAILTSVPLLGALLVHAYVFGIEHPSKETTEKRLASESKSESK
jgi:hypothetical protein